MLTAAPALAAPADLDTSFGAPNGFVLTGVSGGNVNGRGVIIDPATGNYVVGAGQFISTIESMGAMQYLPNGTLDETFGGEDGAAPGTEFVGIMGETTTAESDIVRQPDGSLVLGGYTTPGKDEFALARLTPAGKLDTSFNPAGTQPGTVTTDISPTTSDRISALGIQSSAKIVAIGSSAGALAFARYNTTGTIDGTPVVTSFTGVDSVQPDAAVVEPGDKILVGGEATVGTLEEFMVARLTADGSPDSTFGNGGIVTFTLGSPTSRDFATSIALQPDGDALIAGDADQDSTQDFGVARLTPSGDLDPSFGSGGVSVLSVTPEQDEANGMTLQPNGKVLLVGRAGGIGEGAGDLAVVRLDTSGAPDPTFGTGGVVIHPLPPAEPSRANSVAVQGDGKIVTVGSGGTATGNDVAVARFMGGEVPPPPPPPARDTVKPKLSKLKLLTTHLRTIRKKKALKVRVHMSEAGTLTLKATISVKRRHHKARTITLLRKTTRFTKAATKTITLKLSRSALARLGKLHTLKIKLSFSAKDLAGNKSSRALTAKLKRR
ncbi:MAG TPA: delta-60 repeat domain-containing protein [Thermoleophilaceae bacterium]